MPLNTTHDIQSLRQEARQLRDQHRYAEALPLYEAIWAQFRSEADQWDGWGLAYCLNKTKDYSRALEVARALYTAWPDFSFGKIQYAWAVYYTALQAKDPVPNDAIFMKAAKAVMMLNTQKDQYGPYVRTVFRVLEHLKKKTGTIPEETLAWCDKLDPALLSEETLTHKTHDGKVREMASDKESFYAYKLRALDALERHEAVLQTSAEAFAAIKQFHYDNDVWFRRYEARAKAGMGRLDEAIATFQTLVAMRREWYILYELALFHKEKKEHELTMERAAQACVASASNAHYAIQLYRFMADLLQEAGNSDAARLHVQLALAIRKEQSWGLDKDWTNWAAGYGDCSTNEPSSALLTKLMPQWQAWSGDLGKRRRGAIHKIMPNGSAGFITDADGKSYYFRTNHIKGKKIDIKVGQEVSFQAVEGFDKVKKTVALNARNIKIIQHDQHAKK